MEQKIEHVDSCPLCANSKFSFKFPVQDHYHSKETFNVLNCDICGLGITSPRPNMANIGHYYASEKYASHGGATNIIRDTLYKALQHLNHSIKLRRLIKVVPRGTWCDYGAGNGSFARFAQSRNVDIQGYEPSPAARENALINNCSLRDITEFPTQPTFSCISMWHVLEHVPDLNTVISKLKKGLLPSGIIAIAVPNNHSYDAIHYGKYWAALDVPRHFWHFDTSTIKGLFEKHGFSFVNSFGLPFDAFYISVLSAEYEASSKLSALLIALRSNLRGSRTEPNYSSNVCIFRKNSF